VIKENFSHCKKIEILEFPELYDNKSCKSKINIINLSGSISCCWLLDPFIDKVDVGDMICLTAFYFLMPNQKMINN